MPEDFNSKTYVAFSDLCGFKQMMNENRKKAVKALDCLYESVYDIQNDRARLLRTHVDAIAVSDCIVSWATDEQLDTIVAFLRWFHSRMIKDGYLLRTTIAYDAFCYQRRLQLRNLQKAYIEGGAYISAYLGNDKAEPGMIILLDPDSNHNSNVPCIPKPNGFKWKLCKKTKNWEYFWSAHHKVDISKIKKERTKAKELEFDRLTEIYQGRLKGRN